MRVDDSGNTQARQIPIQASQAPLAEVAKVDLPITLRSVNPDEVLTAKVIKNSEGNFLEVKGQRIPANIPADLKNGQSLDVRLKETADSVQIHKATSATNSEPAIIKLEAALKALGVSKEAILNLKTLLNSQTGSTKFSPEDLSLSKTIDPKTLVLSESLESKDIAKISATLKTIAEPSREGLKEQIKVITETLRLLETSSSNDAKKQIIEAFQKLIPALDNRLDDDPKKAFRQLLEAFKSIGVQTQTSVESLESSLVKFVTQQVDFIKTIEQSMRSILHGTQTDASIELLLRTLSPLVHSQASPTTELGKEFVDFIRNLQKNLLKAYTSDEPYPELKKILEQTSLQLENKFTIKLDLGDKQIYAKPHPDIERPLAIQLRSISSQIKTLLTELEHITKPADLSKSVGKLNEIISDNLIKQISANPSLKELAKDLIDFKQVVKNFSEGTVTTDKLKDVLTKLLNTAQTTEKVLNAAEGFKNLISKDLSSLSVAKLTESLEKVLSKLSNPALKNSVASGLQNEILELTKGDTLPLKSAYTSPIANALLSKELEGLLIRQSNLNPEIKPLIDLLFKLNVSDLANFDKEALRQIAELITATQGKMSGDDVKELKQAIKNLLTQYTDTSTAASAKKSLSKDVLKQFEQLVKGQELLSRMNPIMSAAGEPIMILFPAIIGGLLANFETSFYPPVNNQESNKKKKEKDTTEKAALSVDLPGIGEVSVEMSIRANQAEVIFKVETEQVSELMRDGINKFTDRLAESGFDDSRVVIETSPKAEVAPEWLRTLVQEAAIIA